MKIKGLLSLKKLRKQVSAGKIETVILAFTDHYGRLVGKRADADFFLDSALAGTHVCDYLLTTDMEMEPVPGYDFANWEKGYGDVHLRPDMRTLRKAAWLQKTALVLCDATDEKTHDPIEIAPRSVLLRQIQTLANSGFTCSAASELEYYLFDTDYRTAHTQHYAVLQPAGWYLEDYHILQGTRTEKFTAAARRHLKKSGVPPETSKGEWGLGQHELNIRYADPLTAADRHVIFKQCLKETADRQNLSVTFMAKFHADRAGSSCHLHLSLQKDGKNAFVGKQKIGSLSVSDTFLHFLGGWVQHAADLMPFYAPTVNSYKRFADASWAPTRLAWSHDNRTAGFRITGKGENLRIECRIPGADCNPYLAFAAALASGLDGIKNKIKPPEMFKGNAYDAADVPQVPRTLRDAIHRLRISKFADKVFGKGVVKHYVHHFTNEQKTYDATVTDWERKRYFERI